MITYKTKTNTDHLYQTLKKEAFNTRDEKNPIYREVLKNTGTINFTATLEIDRLSLDKFQHIPGVVAYLCTLRKDNVIISEGRGASIVNGVSKYIEKTILFAKNQALIDSIVRCTKMLDSLQFDTSPKQNSGITLDKEYQVKEVKDFDCITDKQKHYLLTLIRTNVAENKRNEMKKQIDSYSRDQASELIKSLVK